MEKDANIAANLERLLATLGPEPSFAAAPPPPPKPRSRQSTSQTFTSSQSQSHVSPPPSPTRPVASTSAPQLAQATPKRASKLTKAAPVVAAVPIAAPRAMTPSSSADTYLAPSPTEETLLPLTETPFIPPPSRRKSLQATVSGDEHAAMLTSAAGLSPTSATTRPLSPGDPYHLYSSTSDQSSSLNFSIGDDGESGRRVLMLSQQSASAAPAMGRSPSGLSQYYTGRGVPDDEGPHEKDEERGAPASPKGGGFWSRLSSRGKKLALLALVVAVIVIAVAVAVPVAVTRSGRNSHVVKEEAATTQAGPTTTQSAPTGVPTGGSNGTDWSTAATGGDGSVVFTKDGSSFVYNNTFGGFWNAIPFNDSAQAQSDVPPLNKAWDYSTDLISGVNLGGWLVIEPFIVPSLFEPFNSATNDPSATNGAVDEWTLSVALGANMSAVIENHYATFITEKDFAEIAAAGLNWVRIPIPYWIVEVQAGEPFLANVGWTYLLQAIAWARKYGLRINLDLHAVPGSQNGYNHSSKLGTINFLNGVMGIVNAQRTINYIRTLTEFISQPQYTNVVPMFSVLNEPIADAIGVDVLRHFYLEVYNIARAITGVGEGKGPFIAFHDGFTAQSVSIADGGWNGFLPGADRVSIDAHPYLCFDTPNNDGLAYQASKPCSYWGSNFNTSTKQFGLAIAGEWSLAINDCGKWINNVGNGQRFDGTYYEPGTSRLQYDAVGSCDVWNEWWNYTPTVKAGLQQVAEGHMDALRHWFFWTWKTGYSNTVGAVANPLWNYQLGLEQGYIPRNPRAAQGICPSLLSNAGVRVSSNPAPTLAPWMTGGAGAGTITATAQLASYSAWPPTAIGGTAASNFPTLTATGPVITMSAATPTSYPAGFASATGPGNGWANAADNAPWFTQVAGCSYPNAWSGVGATVPAAACTGGAARMAKRAPPSPRATPPPSQKWAFSS